MNVVCDECGLLCMWPDMNMVCYVGVLLRTWSVMNVDSNEQVWHECGV